MDPRVRNAWLDHALIDRFPFPRDVGISPSEPWRVKVKTRREYLRLLQENVADKDLYTSVFPDWSIKRGIFNKIYLDFDSVDLKLAHWDVIKLSRYIGEEYGEYPRIYFTGGRGFHSYLDFEPAKLKHYQEASREYVYDLMEELDLKTLDTHGIGVPRAVSRIPYSIHHSTYRLCIPIEVDWDLDEILWQSKNCEFKKQIRAQPLPGLDEDLKEIDKGCEKFVRSQITFNILSGKNDDRYIRDLDLLLKVAESGLDDFRHRLIFFAIIPRMVLLNKTDKEILDFCREFVMRSSPRGRKSWREYERAAIANIKRTREGGWKPWSWEALLTYYPDLRKQIERVKR